MKRILMVAIGLLSSSVIADVKLQPLFGDNMVLQRNTLTNFWGEADPGEKVAVTGSWGKSSTTTTDKNGKWKLQLETPKAGGPFTVKVKGNNEIILKNIMSGEVWICTGQSNMDCSMSFFKDTKKAISKADYSNIRLFDVGKKAIDNPVDTLKGRWALCTPKRVKGFSATGYFFGLKLYKELNIPIGLIECAWGGTKIESWTPWENQSSNPRLIKARDNAVEQAKSYDEEKEKELHRQAKKKYREDMKAWKDNGKKGQGPSWPSFKRHPLRSQHYPSSLYNGMINPLAPFTIKGGVWYQGESNARYSDEYAEQLEIMTKAWRQKWGQGDFSFYYVQLPGFGTPWTVPAEENAKWAKMREAFTKVVEKTPNTGMAITIDIGEAKDIHPQQKAKVGERLARLALHNDYGRKDIVPTGPVMQSCSFNKGKAIINFENSGSPLTARGNESLKGFSLRDSYGVFFKADAKIVGDYSVEVTSNKVNDPKMVYYGWAQNPEGINLINKAGLPASPFRYGEMPEVNMLKELMPEVEKEYELVYHIDPKNASCRGRTRFFYKKNNSTKIKGPFKKVAYFLALRGYDQKTKYVFVEMDPFSNDVTKIGVPDKASETRLQCPVTNLFVKSNDPEIKTGSFAEGGNIEFWYCDYGGGNKMQIPGATDSYDFGDAISTKTSPGYGSMQIHNSNEKQSLICFNNFNSGMNADIGIGNNKASRHTDWTFSKNASKYAVAELKVLVKK